MWILADTMVLLLQIAHLFHVLARDSIPPARVRKTTTTVRGRCRAMSTSTGRGRATREVSGLSIGIGIPKGAVQGQSTSRGINETTKRST
jgi:hypothetical protein